MTSALPFSRPSRPDPMPGDAERAPRELMSGPGRCWNVEPRWRWAEARLGGQWRLARVEQWRLHQGSTAWVALMRTGGGPDDWGWYVYSSRTVRRAPEPAPESAAADWGW
ncbi:hypothetical protein ACFXPX_13545 [Kitasatospora sp. NPDC059146]|uniref:hypothetical protein n=1 Tax=Kitasatospora sp. NPDC059146 TaxID=3346741 RepID=UPI0036861B19